MRIAILLLTAALTSSSATSLKDIPFFVGMVEEIRVSTPSGWWLHIRPDGGGYVEYGSTTAGSASIPAGTFDFAEVFGALADIGRPTGSIGESFSIAFRTRDLPYPPVQYAGAEEIVGPFFYRARYYWRSHLFADRLDELWLANPPVPITTR